MFSPPLIQDMAIVWKPLFNMLCFWGPKIWDRIQTIPFEIISKASLGPQWDPYSGRQISIFLVALLLGGGGGAKIKETLECRAIGSRKGGQGQGETGERGTMFQLILVARLSITVSQS